MDSGLTYFEAVFMLCGTALGFSLLGRMAALLDVMSGSSRQVRDAIDRHAFITEPVRGWAARICPAEKAKRDKPRKINRKKLK